MPSDKRNLKYIVLCAFAFVSLAAVAGDHYSAYGYRTDPGYRRPAHDSGYGVHLYYGSPDACGHGYGLYSHCLRDSDRYYQGPPVDYSPSPYDPYYRGYSEGFHDGYHQRQYRAPRHAVGKRRD